MTRKNLVVGLYYHPEAFPPTLNAVDALSPFFNRVTLLFRPNLEGVWRYPKNVVPVPGGRFIPSSAQEQAPIWKKLYFFLQFTIKLLTACLRDRPAVVLLYDSHALLSFYLVRPLLPFRPFLWYHNHDIAEAHRLKQFSIGRFALHAEQRIFSRIGLFTIPAQERLAFFPMSSMTGSYFIVPNYPAKKMFLPYAVPKNLTEPVNLVFQGRIDDSHGFEAIIPLLRSPIANRKLGLVLIGHFEPAYRKRLLELARANGVEDALRFEGLIPYLKLPAISSRCHIGIGIFEKSETMHLTLGTASNKLYEYAALGLPVLYNSGEHLEKYLAQFPWAFPVQVNSDSIQAALRQIIDAYSTVSAAAVHSFTERLNYETAFQPVLDFLAGKNLLQNTAAGTLN